MLRKIIINKEESDYCKLCIVYLKFREIEFNIDKITLDENFYKSLGESDLIEKINQGAKVFNELYDSIIKSYMR